MRADAGRESLIEAAQQGDQLWKAAINASRAGPKGFGMEVVDGIDWDTFDGRARQILTPAQFELFNQVSPPNGFDPRSSLRSRNAVRRAQAEDAAAGISQPVTPR